MFKYQLYDQFLQGKSAPRLAAEKFCGNDEAYFLFLRALFANKARRNPRGAELSERLAWFFFEESGWCEGCGYMQDAFTDGTAVALEYFLGMLKRSGPNVSPRLELRRRHWKRPAPSQFLAAHAMLLELLENFSAPCEPQPEPK